MIHPHSEVIQAYIRGEQIQTRTDNSLYQWSDCFSLEEMQRGGLSFPNFNDPNRQWRVKPKVKKIQCRLALFKENLPNECRYYSMGFDSELNSGIDGWFIRGEDPKDPNFVRWLTDPIEIEVEYE